MDTNAQLQSIRDACKRGHGGRAIDQFIELDNYLTAKGAVAVPAPWQPKVGAALVQACHDDSEDCRYCAFPEWAPVVLIIGDVPVCRTHIERGLTATGARLDRNVTIVRP